MRSGVFGS